MMNARVNQNDLTFAVPTAFSPSAVPTQPAPRGGILARFARLANWIADMPRRRAVLDELASLSDHELTDIGLSRNDLGRVFDPAFARQRKAV